MKKHIITITGDIASGKSKVANLLAERLKYTRFSNGDYFRKLALEKNMNVNEFQTYVNNNPDIDLMIENNAVEFSKKNDKVIFDGRMAFYSIPESFKIFLKVDIDTAATRVYTDLTRKKSEDYLNIEETKSSIILRSELEKERFIKLYNIDKFDLKNYDYVLDTTNLTIDEVTDLIIQNYLEWLE